MNVETQTFDPTVLERTLICCLHHKIDNGGWRSHTQPRPCVWAAWGEGLYRSTHAHHSHILHYSHNGHTQAQHPQLFVDGCNVMGKEGWFPATYVELVSEAPLDAHAMNHSLGSDQLSNENGYPVQLGGSLQASDGRENFDRCDFSNTALPHSNAGPSNGPQCASCQCDNVTQTTTGSRSKSCAGTQSCNAN